MRCSRLEQHIAEPLARTASCQLGVSPSPPAQQQQQQQHQREYLRSHSAPLPEPSQYSAPSTPIPPPPPSGPACQGPLAACSLCLKSAPARPALPQQHPPPPLLRLQPPHLVPLPSICGAPAPLPTTQRQFPARVRARIGGGGLSLVPSAVPGEPPDGCRAQAVLEPVTGSYPGQLAPGWGRAALYRKCCQVMYGCCTLCARRCQPEEYSR